MADKWQTKKEFPETNERMLDDEILCDVTFLVGEKSQPMKAHKFILASRSPVFHAMFCGPLAESGDAIRIPDIEVDVFKHLLKYLYTGKCAISPEMVMSLMYAENKYDVINLVSECTDYLKSIMSIDNVYVVLEQAHIFDNQPLIEKCTNFIGDNGKACLESEGFLSLSKQALSDVLASDKLCVNEEDVYVACVRWAKEECKRTGQEVNDANCRTALGEIIQLIRFPIMTQAFFANVVSFDNILTIKEQIDLFRYIVCRHEKAVCPESVGAFSCIYRYTPKVVCVNRCDVVGINGWNHTGKTDAISFTTSESAVLRGIGLYDPVGTGTVGGKLEVIKGDTVLHSMNVTLQYDQSTHSSDVMFDKRIAIESGVVYTITQTFTGVRTYRGEKGRSTVLEDGLTVTFTDSDKSKNGTRVDSGQFKHVYFTARANKAYLATRV